ncbi:MAG: metallophosphoesterase family protein [Candidatus Rokubacteria bacterium]|nr:metallophosphoesterase family protein [Candidatus Rokubacteria bacterium]
MPRAPRRLGLISDTHGLLRPEALAALAGSDLIVHAGDVGDPAVLDALRALAPVIAVRGNNDVGAWARRLPERQTFRFGSHVVRVVHDVAAFRAGAGEGVSVVMSGHSHRAVIERRAGVLFVNPGSAGPRRFRLPVTIARIDVVASGLRPRIVTLTPAPARVSSSPRPAWTARS